MNNSQRYINYAEQLAQSAGLPKGLITRIIKQESGGSHYDSHGKVITSSAGARGIMQLMPATAKGLGVNPDDPMQNIKGGVKFLSNLNKKYKGNIPLVLAAYNAGPGNVDKFGGVPPFPETKNYVKSIMSSLQPINKVVSAKIVDKKDVPQLDLTPITGGLLAGAAAPVQAETSKGNDNMVDFDMGDALSPLDTSSGINQDISNSLNDYGFSGSVQQDLPSMNLTPMDRYIDNGGEGLPDDNHTETVNHPILDSIGKAFGSMVSSRQQEQPYQVQTPKIDMDTMQLQPVQIDQGLRQKVLNIMNS